MWAPPPISITHHTNNITKLNTLEQTKFITPSLTNSPDPYPLTHRHSLIPNRTRHFFAMAIHSTFAISYASLSPIEPQFKPKPKTKLNPPPLSISTNRSSVDPLQIQHLFASCGHSCHRFPRTGPDGRVEPVELEKLRVALAHSFVVVSVLCKARFLEGEMEKDALGYGFGDLFGDSDQRLVGFGRAVSDCGLTASIHDVVVIPSLQRRGIGQRIVNRILRILTSRGIYDISALCTEKERLFFKACGFGFDSLGSTTMMYTQSPGPTTENDGFMVTTAGRMQLLVPPPTHQLKLWKKE